MKANARGHRNGYLVLVFDQSTAAVGMLGSARRAKAAEMLGFTPFLAAAGRRVTRVTRVTRAPYKRL